MIDMGRRTFVMVVILFLFTVFFSFSLIETPNESKNHKTSEPSITNVTLGYISSATSYLAQDQFLISHALNDINEYCESNDISYRFYISIRDAEGHAENAAKFTQEFIENNVSLIGGYAWSSHLGASIHTTTKYNGILFSTASKYLYYGRPEQVFRLCPTDLHQVKPIIAMLADYNVSRIIIFRGADAWADLIADEFTLCYSGEILEEIEYPVAGTDFRKGLERLETSLNEYNESNKPCVLFLDKYNPAMVLAQAVDFPVLLNIKWFGSSDGYARKQILDDAGEVAAKVGLISLMITVDPG